MKRRGGCLCVALNPAVDRTLSIPGFAAGQVNRVTAEDSRPGGKAVNAAAALADEGVPVALTGFFGAENLALFEDFCARRGITSRLIPIPGSTRTGLKIVDPETRVTTDINFPGTAPTAEALDTLHAILGGTEAEWVVLAGSLPPGVPADLYAALMTLLRRRGIKTALDTSGEAFRRAVAAGPCLIKPNLAELRELTGRPLDSPADVAAEAAALVRGGIPLAAVSMGAEGAVFADESGVILARPPAVRIRTTVGAGDAMLAGLVSARLRGLSLAEAARLATARSLRAIAEKPPSPETLAEIEVTPLEPFGGG